jgi:hypothetical protein
MAEDRLQGGDVAGRLEGTCGHSRGEIVAPERHTGSTDDQGEAVSDSCI